MHVSICHPKELGPAERASWSAFQADSDQLDSAFLSYEFAEVVGRHNDNARVAVIADGAQTVGFFAYELEGGRLARPIGAGFSDVQGVVHSQAFQLNLRELLNACNIAMFEFDHLITTQATQPGVHARNHDSPVLDVTGGYDAYMERDDRVNRKSVKGFMRKQRNLERDNGQCSLEFDSHDGDALQQVMAWKSDQYRRTGFADIFAKPEMRAVVEDLALVESPDLTGRLSVLKTGDQQIAIHFGLQSRRTLALWFPAYDPQFGKYSPGITLLLEIAKASTDYGFRYMDLGKGDESYKQSFKSFDHSVSSGWIGGLNATTVLRRARKAPVERAEQFVLDNPKLRAAARKTLRTVGKIRQRNK